MKKHSICTLIALHLAAAAFAQAPPPPISFLSQLLDTRIVTPADKQVLTYVFADSKWENVLPSNTTLSSLTDVSLTSPAAGNLLQYNGSVWINHAPVFSDLGGNIAVSQMNSGSGASSLTYWRGDNTWASPPTGAIPATNYILAGDGAGNAIASNWTYALGSATTIWSPPQGDYDVNVSIQNGNTSAAAMASLYLRNDSGNLAEFRYFSTAFAPGPGILAPRDLQILNLDPSGNLELIGGTIKFSNDVGSFTERMRLGIGLMVGTTTDPGAGMINLLNGIKLNGSAGTNGQVPVSNGTATTWSSDVPRDSQLIGYRALGSVLVAMPIAGGLENITSSFALTSATVQFIPVYLPVSATITGVKFYMSAQGVYTADTSNVVALYSYSGGTLTRQAISADNGNLWKATANTWSSQAFSATFNATPGLYYIGLLYHTSAQTSAPKIGSGTTLNNIGVVTLDFTNSAKLYATLGLQTTCPATQAMSGLTSDTNTPWAALY